MRNSPMYYEYKDNNHNKFWAANIIKEGEKWKLVRKWGKIGNDSRNQVDYFDDGYKAREKLEALRESKVSSGYKAIF